MTETQVIKALRGWKAVRSTQGETLAFLNSVSLAPPEDPEDEINKLRSQLSSRANRGVRPFYLSDCVEDALKKRLETLRKNRK